MEQSFSKLKDAGSKLLEDEKKIRFCCLALEAMEDLKLDFVKNRFLGEEEIRKKL